MKALIVTACLALLVAPAHAKSKTEMCRQWGELARTVMEIRQLDGPMAGLMATLEKTANGERAAESVRQMVIVAYERPSFSTAENQRKAIAEFGNDAELACYSSMSAE